MRELLRVTRPGGALCICEPVWDTLTVSTPPAAASAALRAAMLERVRNPYIGRELAALLRDAGARRVEVSGEAMVVRDRRRFRCWSSSTQADTWTPSVPTPRPAG